MATGSSQKQNLKPLALRTARVRKVNTLWPVSFPLKEAGQFAENLQKFVKKRASLVSEQILEETALLKAYAGGDSRAALLLTKHLAPRLLAYTARILGGDMAEAEDVTQDVMVRLWKAAAQWDAQGSAKPSTWAFKIATNLCIDKKRKWRWFGGSLDQAPEPVDQALSAEAHMVQAARLKALDHALSQLPMRQRVAVVLRHIEGCSNQEIAEHLDVKISAVESLTARGKRKLTALMASQKEVLGYEDAP